MKFRLIGLLIAIVALYYAVPRLPSAYAEELDCLLEPYDVVDVSSPVEGVLETVTVDRGDRVKKGQVIARLESSSVSWLGKVSVGAQAEILPEAPMNSVHVARVTVVDPVVDAASGTVGIRLELPNPKYRIPAGLKCKVRFLSGRNSPS